MNFTLKRRMEQVLRRWWVVAVVTVVAVLAAATNSLPAHPTYTGKSALMLSGRIPEQDAIMILGYLSLFNDPATTDLLRTTANVPENVTFEAKTAAASPILTIEATADDPQFAQNIAVNIGEKFKAYVNTTQAQGREDSVAALESQLSKVEPFEASGVANPYYVALRQRIDETRVNSTNNLMTLQPRAGVIKNNPSVVFNLVTGAVGGLLLGVLAALGLAALSTRLTNSDDLRDKTGVEPLAEVSAGRGVEPDRLRKDRLRELANIISLEDLPKPAVITLTDSRGGRGARDIAKALAELSAQQGSRTVLVYADNNASQPAVGPGFNDALADGRLVHDVLKDGDVKSLRILPAGSILRDRYSLVTRDRMVTLLDELRTGADTIIVAAPSIGDNTETQLLCAAADVTILVVTRGLSRVGDVTSAAAALANAHAVLLGAVLIDEPNRKHQEVHQRAPGPSTRSQAPASNEPAITPSNTLA